MPFVAINNTGLRICSLDYDDLRSAYRQGSLKCPLCEAPMIYKHGIHMRPHFAHKAACTADYEHKPESPEHLEAKIQVREMLLSKYPAATVDLEVPFPEVKRVADVVLELNGWKTVYEIQYSGITEEEIALRTDDYESLGLAVEWCLGGAANTPAIREWAKRRFGEYVEMFAE